MARFVDQPPGVFPMDLAMVSSECPMASMASVRALNRAVSYGYGCIHPTYQRELAGAMNFAFFWIVGAALNH